MVLVPHGEFTMGSQDHQDEKPHNVVLDAYYIDKYEVSNERLQSLHESHTARSARLLGRPTSQQT